jgi:NADH:ubiquinone oxidoreductase subunit 2 (subunit N)
MPHGLLGGIGLIGAMAASAFLWKRDVTGFGVIVVDHYAIFLNITLCAIGLLTIMLSSGPAKRDHLPTGEYQALMLFSIVGMMVASTYDLLVSSRARIMSRHT